MIIDENETLEAYYKIVVYFETYIPKEIKSSDASEAVIMAAQSLAHSNNLARERIEELEARVEKLENYRRIIC